MPAASDFETVTVPEFDAEDLGIPFKVILVDSVTQIINPRTGEVEKTIIPNVPGLLTCVAMARIMEPRKLNGPELKFIRKVFRVPAKKLAEKIGVTPEHLSRCEANDRVLSAGAEKCLRISLFIDNFRLPEEVELPEGAQKDEETTSEFYKFLNMYKKAIRKIEDILDEMRINSAHAVEDELVLAFRTHRSSEDLFQDDPNADWCSNDNEHVIAA